MVNPFPYIPYWVNDFAGDPLVEAMSTLGVGAYHRLLWKAWYQKPVGTLPDDDRLLAAWSRLSDGDWSAVKSEVLACFKLSKDGRWHQKRMKAEFQRLREKTAEKKMDAQKAANAKWRLYRQLHANAEQPHSGCNANSESESDPKRKKKNQAAAPLAVDDPSLWMVPASLDSPEFREAWRDFVRHRQALPKKAWLTPLAAEKTFKQLIPFGREWAISALDRAVASKWQGVVFSDDIEKLHRGSKASPASAQMERVKRLREATENAA